jgi:propanol-preferring alcohol dehydrogenase
VTTDTLENINDVFGRMHRGEIEGRVVIDFENPPVAANGTAAAALVSAA